MIIIIILVLILIILGIVIFFITRKNPENFENVKTAVKVDAIVSTNIIANWYDLENGVFPEEEYIEKKADNNIVGIAFSGGGTRAACSTWGILQALNSYNTINCRGRCLPTEKTLIDRYTIQYMSANSGSTWVLLPLLYQQLDSNLTLTDILGTYKDPSDPSLDFKSTINSPQFGYNATNNEFFLNITPDWWADSVANSFFKPYGMFEGEQNKTKSIVGIDKTKINSIISNAGNSLKGSVVRDNVPIPIAIQTLYIDKDNIFAMDSSPISTGFFRTYNENENPDLKKLSGRVDSYAFNMTNNQDTLGNSSVFVYKDDDNIWNEVMMSGTSSMAAGEKLAGVPKMFPLLSTFTAQNKTINKLRKNNVIQKENEKIKIIDGYLSDDTSVMSLITRKANKIVISINPQFEQILSNAIDISTKNVVISAYPGNYVYINTGEYQNSIAIINSIQATTTMANITLIGYYTIPGNEKTIDILLSSLNLFYIGQIELLFKGNMGDEQFKTNPGIFENNNNEYDNTIKGMVLNYANTGIFYYRGTYKTKNLPDFNIKPYNVDILWYCLSPSPTFYNMLSQENKTCLNNLYQPFNPCTFFPYYNDCGSYDKCDEYCRSENDYIEDLMTNISNVQKISNVQAMSISSLTGWVCNQIIIPFILDLPFPQEIKPKFIPNSIIIPKQVYTQALKTDILLVSLKEFMNNFNLEFVNAFVGKTIDISNESFSSVVKCWDLPSIQLPGTSYPTINTLYYGFVLGKISDVKFSVDISTIDDILYSCNCNDNYVRFDLFISGNIKHSDGAIGITIKERKFYDTCPESDSTSEIFTNLFDSSSQGVLKDFNLNLKGTMNFKIKTVQSKDTNVSFDFTDCTIKIVELDLSDNSDALSDLLTGSLANIISTNNILNFLAYVGIELLTMNTIAILSPLLIQCFTANIIALINPKISSSPLIKNLGTIYLPFECDNCTYNQKSGKTCTADNCKEPKTPIPKRQLSVSCPDNCSNNGICNTVTGKCLCYSELGWTGENCSNLDCNYISNKKNPCLPTDDCSYIMNICGDRNCKDQGKNCGDNGYGGSCGTCNNQQKCDNGKCVDCIPICTTYCTGQKNNCGTYCNIELSSGNQKGLQGEIFSGYLWGLINKSTGLSRKDLKILSIYNGYYIYSQSDDQGTFNFYLDLGNVKGVFKILSVSPSCAMLFPITENNFFQFDNISNTYIYSADNNIILTPLLCYDKQ